MIGRRGFISLLGGAAAWPLRARAQQAVRMRRIVFLHALARNDPEAQVRIAAFQQGLAALGWTEKRNIEVEHRFAGGDFAQVQAEAAQAASSAPDLIAASGTVVVAALKQATRTIPIVFCMVSDPVDLVASLARPGGNITGFTFIDFPLIGKWVQMLKEIAPGVRRMMLLFNPQTAPFYPPSCASWGRQSWPGFRQHRYAT